MPIHVAAINKNPNLCRELITTDRLNINEKSHSNLAALHIACHFGIEQNVEELLSYPHIDINAVYSNGTTALHHAARKRHITIYTRIANDLVKTRRNNHGRRAVDDLVGHLKNHTINKPYEEVCVLADALDFL